MTNIRRSARGFAGTFVGRWNKVGELAAKAIEYEIDEEHPEIAWRQMRGMRNRIVHDYEGVRLEIVWETIQDSFPELLKKLEGEDS